jgi:DNA topoisomerase II
MQLEKLANQVRFVQMIIKKELSVSGRKRAEIERDLKTKGFKSFPKTAKPGGDAETTEVSEEAAEGSTEETGSDSLKGYDYLLSVSLLSNAAKV